MHFVHTPEFSICNVDVGRKSTTVTFCIAKGPLETVTPFSGGRCLSIRALRVGHSLVDVNIALELSPEED